MIESPGLNRIEDGDYPKGDWYSYTTRGHDTYQRLHFWLSNSDNSLCGLVIDRDRIRSPIPGQLRCGQCEHSLRLLGAEKS